MTNYRREKSARATGGRARTLNLYQRAQEAIEFLMECNGHTTLNKRDFAVALAARYGRYWLRMDSTGDATLVSDVCNVTRDQDIDPVAESLFGGYVVSYAPSAGGMTLVNPEGEMALDQLLHMLAGDLLRQKSTATINRRRVSYWKSAGKSAALSNDAPLSRLCWQIEHDIESTGFVSDTLIADYLRSVSERGVTV